MPVIFTFLPVIFIFLPEKNLFFFKTTQNIHFLATWIILNFQNNAKYSLFSQLKKYFSKTTQNIHFFADMISNKKNIHFLAENIQLY